MNDPSPESALADIGEIADEIMQLVLHGPTVDWRPNMAEIATRLRTHGAHFAALARQVESLTSELDFMTARY